ncbi:MAG: hypothetical protein ABGZ35_07080, partial [Planctomycetaceae bacterium]
EAQHHDLRCSPLPAPASASSPSKATTPRMRTSRTRPHTRVPALTLPAQLNHDGLPLGIQLLSRTGQDMTLLAAGAIVESAIGFDARPV